MTFSLVCILVILVGHASADTAVTIENNGYQNVLVVIDESVPEDQQLVQHIKNAITNASAFLYQITRYHFLY